LPDQQHRISTKTFSPNTTATQFFTGLAALLAGLTDLPFPLAGLAALFAGLAALALAGLAALLGGLALLAFALLGLTERALAGNLAGDFSIDFLMPVGAETALAVGFFAAGGVLVVVVVVVVVVGLSCCREGVLV